MSTEPDRSEALYTELATTRITRATSAMVDTYAAREDRKRAHMLRVLIAEAVAARQQGEASEQVSPEFKATAAKVIKELDPVLRQLAPNDVHGFEPGKNPLKCKFCGVKVGDHR